MRVKAVVTVVPHHKHIAFRNTHSFHFIIKRFQNELLIFGNVIHIQFTISHFHIITSRCHNSFYEDISRTITNRLHNRRSFEDHDIRNSRLPENIRHLLCHYSITHIQSRVHRCGRNRPWLCQRGLKEQSDT
nr:hypothetical protein Iba_chr14aCG18840 [Ipomoea batatas]